MGFKRVWVEDWFAGHAEAGEQLLSYAVTATWTGVVVTGTYDIGSFTSASAGDLTLKGEEMMRERIAGMPLDPEGHVSPLTQTTFLALTDRRLLLGSRSSMRNRPKDLLHAAPADGVRVHWFDHHESVGNRFRHLLVEFGDGHWRADRSGLSAFGKDLTGTSNIHHFFEALGPRAVPLEG